MECQSELNIHHDFFQFSAKRSADKVQMLDLPETRKNVQPLIPPLMKIKSNSSRSRSQIVRASQIRIVSLKAMRFLFYESDLSQRNRSDFDEDTNSKIEFPLRPQNHSL